MPRPNSRTERSRKTKISRMEVHHKSNPRTYLEVDSSKVKVTRSTNAEPGSASYLPNGKAYELGIQTENDDPYH